MTRGEILSSDLFLYLNDKQFHSLYYISILHSLHLLQIHHTLFLRGLFLYQFLSLDVCGKEEGVDFSLLWCEVLERMEVWWMPSLTVEYFKKVMFWL